LKAAEFCNKAATKCAPSCKKETMSQFFPVEFAGWAVRLLLVQAVIFVFLLLSVVSFSLPHAGDLKPFFLLMIIYYWSIYRPTVIPLFYTFILGLMLDVLTHLPIGLNALLLVAIETLILRSRIFLMGQSYIVVWLGFMVVALLYALGLWLGMTLASFQFPPASAFLSVILASILSGFLFPLASLIFQAIHKILPPPQMPMRTVR
jgi:rod shape-determining protein MreD